MKNALISGYVDPNAEDKLVALDHQPTVEYKLVDLIAEEGMEGDATQSDKTSAVEKSALQRISGDSTGGSEFRQILRDWFPRLREQVVGRKGADADLSDYEREIEDTFPILESIRWAFIANERLNAPVRASLWAWPTDTELLIRPKAWNGTSPADADKLADALSDYIERPWLQHNLIDGAAINALLFSALAYWRELHLMMVSGLSFMLSGGNQLRMLWITPVLRVAGFLARWIMLPALAMGLAAAGYEKGANIAIGLWIVYLLYRLVMMLRRKGRRYGEEAGEAVAATMIAWQYSNGSVINPSRLKQLVLAAEQKGAAFKPVLHTLIDRAIQRDPTALVTRKATVSP